MEIVKLTEVDTKPIKCSYPADIDGYQFTLLVGTEAGISQVATISDAANGQYFFPRPAGLVEGQYEAAIKVADAEGFVETSDPFLIVVGRRP